MRTIAAKVITEAVARLCIEANRLLPPDVEQRLRAFRDEELFTPARDVLDLLLKNASVARETELPVCQDTGLTVIFAEVGQDVHIEGSFEAAIQEGVRQGYVNGLLRKSMVADPLRRTNTGDNTPATVHIRLVPGENIRLTVAPKGGGSENMSRLAMLTPAEGVEGVKRFVLDTVRQAGANPCPPIILGVGVGGDFEGAAILSKRALTLPLDQPNPDPYYASLEGELLELVNATGIGPQGFGGHTTCIGVHVLAAPSHIASLPVAVNIGCHVTRHAACEL